MKRWIAVAGLAALVTAGTPARAGITVYEEGDKKIEIGGRVQVQYLRIDPDAGDAKDDLFFRRLRPYIAGTVTKNWFGKIQIDFGKNINDNELQVKDAFARYSGFGDKDIQLYIGNQKTTYSREFNTSSKRLQVVERSFAGDHNFGTPDRFIGLRLDGKTASKKISYGVSAGMENHDPDVRRLDFDTPANDEDDWNEGALFAARIDFHPLGYMKFDRGDFHSDEFKFTVGAAAYVWNNDDDVNTYTDPNTGLSTSTTKADLNKSQGFEISGGLRGFGWSADAEYHMIDVDSVDDTFTGGIYMNGSSDLDIFGFSGGYMLPNDRVEFAATWSSIDADGYQEEWERTEVGVNLYLNKHKAKMQINYRMGENVFGVSGDDQDTIVAQAQFVF